MWIERDDLAITVNGEEVLLDACGAALVRAHSTLIFADLHFEKASSYAERGQPLPPYDTALTLAALSEVIDRRTPRRVICLGDSFHDRRAGERLQSKDAEALRALTRLAYEVPPRILIAGSLYLAGHVLAQNGTAVN